MKKYFFTGLVTLLPFTLTLLIAIFIVNLLTIPFQGLAESVLLHYGILDDSFLFLSGKHVLMLWSKVVALVLLCGLMVVIGFLAQKWIFTSFMHLSEVLIHRIPFVNLIYKSVKEMIRSFFDKETSSFSSVALIPFPCTHAYSIGLISQNEASATNSNKIAVFVPTIPNLTFGYTILMEKEDVIFIDMKVEDAIRAIVSCGIMFSDFELQPVTTETRDLAAK